MSKPQIDIHTVRVDEEISVVTYTFFNPSTTKSYLVEIKAEGYVHADFVVAPMRTGQLDMIIAHEDLRTLQAQVHDIDFETLLLCREMQALKC